jgi:hypothetical protein
MVRKTRKNGDCRRSTKKKGGARKKLPGVTEEMTLEEFEKKWDVFYISAHGGISDDTITMAKNTYILNTTPTTEVCRMHPDLKKLGILYENDNKHVISYKSDFMEAIRKPRLIVPFLYKRSQLTDYKPGSNDIPLVTSIYEPSDEIYDMTFVFNSHVVKNENQETKGITHFVVPGIFKLPMSKHVKNVRNELLKDTRGKIKEKLPEKELEKILENANTSYIKLEENLLKDIKSELGIKENKLLLSDILNSSYLQPSIGKKRLILIHACKSIIGKHNEENIKAHRRYSLSRIILSELHGNKEEINQNEWNKARNLAGQKIIENEEKEAAREAARKAAAAAKKKAPKNPTLAQLLKEAEEEEKQKKAAEAAAKK